MTSLIDDMKSDTRKVEILVVRMSVPSGNIHILMSVTLLWNCELHACDVAYINAFSRKSASASTMR